MEKTYLNLTLDLMFLGFLYLFILRDSTGSHVERKGLQLTFSKWAPKLKILISQHVHRLLSHSSDLFFVFFFVFFNVLNRHIRSCVGQTQYFLRILISALVRWLPSPGLELFFSFGSFELVYRNKSGPDSNLHFLYLHQGSTFWCISMCTDC